MTSATSESAVLTLDDERYAAMRACDLDRLGALLADGLTYTHSTGVVETKAQYLDALRSGRVKYVRVERRLDHFAAWGSCAVLQGRLDVEAEVDAQPYRTRALFTSTWVQQAGEWSMAAWASTREKQETP